MPKILICGSRYLVNNKNNRKIIRKYLKQYDKKDTTIIHGNCIGADIISGSVARKMGFNNIQKFPADWKKYGYSAGPIRNKLMLDQNPDLVIAFHNNIDNSKGTKHMVKISREKNVKVIVENSVICC